MYGFFLGQGMRKMDAATDRHRIGRAVVHQGYTGCSVLINNRKMIMEGLWRLYTYSNCDQDCS